jgi:hypothetical protein
MISARSLNWISSCLKSGFLEFVKPLQCCFSTSHFSESILEKTLRMAGLFFMHTRFLIVSTAVLIYGCTTQDILPENVAGAGSDFYPIGTGNTWIYQVDTVRYSSKFDVVQNKVVTDTFRGRYFMKEVIADSIGLQQGNPLFRVDIFRAPDSSGPWNIDSVWSIQRGKDKILKTENNRPVVKLKFPVTEKSRWDGNQYNMQQDSSGSSWFTIQNFNKDFLFGNKLLPSFKVIQKLESNCLYKLSSNDVFLKNIGPAFMERSQISFSQEGPDPCGNLPRIESGKVRIFTLLRFEKSN